MDQTDLSKPKRWIAFACAFCLQCVLGANGFFGFVNPYLCSFYYNNGNRSVTQADTSQANTVRLIFFDVGLFFSTYLIEIFGFRPVIIIGSILYGFSFILVSFTSSLTGLFITYSVIGGIFQGIQFIQPTFAVMTSFPNKKGIITSTIMTGGVVATILVGNMAQEIINPQDESPDQNVVVNGHTLKYFKPEITDRVPMFFWVLGLISIFWGIFFGLFIFTGSQFKGKIQLYIESKMRQVDDEYEDVEEDDMPRKLTSRVTTGSVLEAAKSILVLEKDENIMNESLLVIQPQTEKTKLQVLKEVLGTREFYILFICKFTSNLPGSYQSAMFKSYGLYQHLDDSFLTFCGTMGLITTIIIKFPLGLCLDRFGFKRPWQGLLICVMFSMVGLITLSSTKLGFLVMNSIATATVGATLVVYTATSQIIYGRKKGPIVYSFLSVSTLFASFSQSLILFFQSKLGFERVYAILLGFGAFSYLLMSFAREKRYK